MTVTVTVTGTDFVRRSFFAADFGSRTLMRAGLPALPWVAARAPDGLLARRPSFLAAPSGGRGRGSRRRR